MRRDRRIARIDTGTGSIELGDNADTKMKIRVAFVRGKTGEAIETSQE